MSISQIVDKFSYSINLAKAYQGGIILPKSHDVSETKRRILWNNIDPKESYFGTAQKFFLEEIINEFAYAIDDEIYHKNFTLVEDDNVTDVIDYLKRGEVPIKRFNDVVLMCLPQADKYLMAKYKFLIADTKIDDRILTAISNLGIKIV